MKIQYIPRHFKGDQYAIDIQVKLDGKVYQWQAVDDFFDSPESAKNFIKTANQDPRCFNESEIKNIIIKNQIKPI